MPLEFPLRRTDPNALGDCLRSPHLQLASLVLTRVAGACIRSNIVQLELSLHHVDGGWP